MSEELWHDLKIFAVTLLVLIFIVVPVVAFLFHRDIQKGNLKLDQLIQNLFKRLV
jgi:hypothetical protein